MTDEEIKMLQMKLQITEVAVQRYIEQDGTFSLHDVAEDAEMEVGEIFNYFPNKDAILIFYYTSLVMRYRMMLDDIDDFSSYTLGEKLSNFMYTSFDMMQEQEAFVKKTFDSLVLKSFVHTDYEKKIEELLADFFQHDDAISPSNTMVLNDCAYRAMCRKYLFLVHIWLNDASEGREMTLELVDKLTGLIQELFYTSVVDRSIDLVKFLASNDLLKRNIPFWNKITSKFDIRL